MLSLLFVGSCASSEATSSRQTNVLAPNTQPGGTLYEGASAQQVKEVLPPESITPVPDLGSDKWNLIEATRPDQSSDVSMSECGIFTIGVGADSVVLYEWQEGWEPTDLDFSYLGLIPIDLDAGDFRVDSNGEYWDGGSGGPIEFLLYYASEDGFFGRILTREDCVWEWAYFGTSDLETRNSLPNLRWEDRSGDMTLIATLPTLDGYEVDHFPYFADGLGYFVVPYPDFEPPSEKCRSSLTSVKRQPYQDFLRAWWPWDSPGSLSLSDLRTFDSTNIQSSLRACTAEDWLMEVGRWRSKYDTINKADYYETRWLLLAGENAESTLEQLCTFSTWWNETVGQIRPFRVNPFGNTYNEYTADQLSACSRWQ